MILVYSNNSDITADVAKNSVKINEQLNNRRNTLSFKTIAEKVSEWQTVEVFEWFELVSSVSGSSVLFVDNTFEFEKKFRVWDEILLDIKWSNKNIVNITWIDHTAKTITVNKNVTLPIRAKCGRKIFWWVVIRNPDKEIWMTGTFEYRVTVNDWSSAFDRKVVVETFEDIYLREILGKTIYEFTANDTETVIDNFETPWTKSWVARVMIADSNDRIQGTNSMKAWTTWSGTAKWTKTVALNLSNEERYKLWWKIKDGSKVDLMTVRVWTNSSNYYEKVSIWNWIDNEDCWNYESFDFNRCTEVWTVDLSNITWVEIEIISNASIPSGDIHFDQIIGTSWGFTLQNTIRWDVKFEDVRLQYKKPTVMVENLAKLQGMFWYIDYDRDLHFFKSNSKTAPFSITDTSLNYSDLSISVDISEVKNRQTIRWGIAPDEALYTQEKVCDWVEESWRLDYPPKTLKVYVDSWSGFVEKTVWVENLVDETTVNYVFNFTEKTVRRWNDTIIANGDKIKLEYYPFKAIRVRFSDPTSIAAMKALTGWDWIFDGAVISDNNIKTWEEARLRAKAETDAYSNPIVTITFKTQIDGLVAGQLLSVQDSSRWIDDQYLIQKVSRISRENELWTYSVTASSTMFWIIEFFQLLLKKADRMDVDVSEIVDIVLNVDEVLTISVANIFTQKNKIAQAGDLDVRYWDFIEQEWTATSTWDIGTKGTQWYAQFEGTETGSASFDESSRYNDNKSLKLTANNGWNGQELKCFSNKFPIKNTSYKLNAFVEMLADLWSLGTGGSCKVEFLEYTNKTDVSPTNTTEIFSGTTKQDFTRSEVLRTTTWNFWQIVVKLYRASGTVSVSDIGVIEQWTDTATNPIQASFWQVT